MSGRKHHPFRRYAIGIPLAVVKSSKINGFLYGGGIIVTGVDFLNATPKTMPRAVHISIAYNGAKTITFRAVQGKKTFTHSIQLPHKLSTVLGGPVGYVGFTGATADHRFGPTEAQGITHFSLHTGAPPTAGTPKK